MVMEEAQAWWTPHCRREDRRTRVQQRQIEGVRSEPQETVLQAARQGATEGAEEGGEAEKKLISAVC